MQAAAFAAVQLGDTALVEFLTARVENEERSHNDRLVAPDLLRNANIAAGGVLPMCQDTAGHRITPWWKFQRWAGRSWKDVRKPLRSAPCTARYRKARPA